MKTGRSQARSVRRGSALGKPRSVRRTGVQTDAVRTVEHVAGVVEERVGCAVEVVARRWVGHTGFALGQEGVASELG